MMLAGTTVVISLLLDLLPAMCLLHHIMLRQACGLQLLKVKTNLSTMVLFLVSDSIPSLAESLHLLQQMVKLQFQHLTMKIQMEKLMELVHLEKLIQLKFFLNLSVTSGLILCNLVLQALKLFLQVSLMKFIFLAHDSCLHFI